ncbi:helicase [Tanacetum coccineum]
MPASGTQHLPHNTNVRQKQKVTASTSNHPLNNSEMRTSEQPRVRASRKITKRAALTSAEGKLLLPKFKDTPSPLAQLLDYTAPGTSKFREQIRVYNGMFCFTSFGARIDHSINTGRGVYTFRINGQNYHRIGSLLPAPGFQPRYAQLYFFDTHNEVKNRMTAFLGNETGEGVDATIVTGLIAMLDETSAMAKAFRMARNWCHAHNSVNFELHLLSERKTSARKYNTPTVSEVAALITNDFGDGIATRDIVVDSKDGGPKRISELHPSYMALQYPLLFPYGEDRFHEKIPYHNNAGARKTKRGFVSMKEYYAYIIQQRSNQANTLLRGGRLYQQFLVDAYTAVEEQRLKWTRNNQDTLRVDLYHNLNDVVTRGDTHAEGLGKQIVLPRIFIGRLRYMIQNYQDAMALCRAYGNPDLFITFTSNLKWPEITKMLALIPGQKPHDRPEVGTRVFKMKLTELLDDLTKREIFGKSRAEIPCPTDDPESYKVVTEFMLHGPCGKGAACTVEGKCSKRFPKPFYAKTIIDDDGYPVYRQRDSKCFAVKIDEAPCEAVWRLFSFDIHYSYPSVMKLNFHLEDQNAITLRDSQNLPALLESEDIKLTIFTEWFELNKRDTDTRKITYDEIPKYYVWHEQAKFWQKRKQKNALGEFTISNQIQEKEDILHKKRKLFKYPELQLTDEQLKNYCLLEIEALLNRNGISLTDFLDLP